MKDPVRTGSDAAMDEFLTQTLTAAAGPHAGRLNEAQLEELIQTLMGELLYGDAAKICSGSVVVPLDPLDN